MTMELVVFALGALLLLIGIVGGGFELKEVKIPRVGRVARVLATTAGTVLILAGISMVAQPIVNGSSPGSSPPPIATESKAVPVTFKITDQLGDGQLSEQVTVLLHGRRVGNLTVNSDFPYSEIIVTVNEPGVYSYTVEATAWFVNRETNEPFQYTGVGQGMIQVDYGSVFTVVGSASGNSWVVTLVES
jgi:hypothetical protein